MKTSEAIEHLEQRNACLRDIVANDPLKEVNLEWANKSLEANQHAIDFMKRYSWKPIETCKNSPCVVYFNGNVGEAVNRKHEWNHYEHDEWWWANLDSEYGETIYPTHWMPLPPTEDVE